MGPVQMGLHREEEEVEEEAEEQEFNEGEEEKEEAFYSNNQNKVHRNKKQGCKRYVKQTQNPFS